MNDDYCMITSAAMELASQLPFSVMTSLAEAIQHRGCENWLTARSLILQTLPTPEFRDTAQDFLDKWRMDAEQITAPIIAAILSTAAQAELTHRQNQTVELVWTGPETQNITFRQTEQAILEVVNLATKSLTLVSYAVFRIPRIQQALIAAAHRGVHIRVIVETPNRIEGQNEYDCLIALGDKVAAVSSVYYWPLENRQKDSNGKAGILHVKCVVADGRCLFLSSANLTEYAFTINMELGLLVKGGKLPRQVEEHFDRLMNSQTILPI
jgi:phosphatidylserine/phosphatidylglycerophosphate/cardiolipin synthase-like enzyme